MVDVVELQNFTYLLAVIKVHHCILFIKTEKQCYHDYTTNIIQTDALKAMARS